MNNHSNAFLFENKANAYASGRGGYSSSVYDLIDSLLPKSEAIRIADIGSGTGIFSEELLKRHYHTYCVESSESMRRKAEDKLCRYEGFHSVGALAEQTGLPDGLMDMITVASAFHWFDGLSFLKECRRILKKDGLVFIVGNSRHYGDAFTKEHHELCLKFCPSFTSFNHGGEYTEATCPGFFPKEYGKKVFQYDLCYTNAQFFSRCMSSSYSLKEQDANYTAYCDALSKLIERYSQNGSLIVRNETVAWYGAVK